MITAMQQELLKQIEQLLKLSPDIRFGQRIDHLGLLDEDRGEWSLRDVEDERLMAVVERHRGELERRHQPVG